MFYPKSSSKRSSIKAMPRLLLSPSHFAVRAFCHVSQYKEHSLIFQVALYKGRKEQKENVRQRSGQHLFKQNPVWRGASISFEEYSKNSEQGGLASLVQLL